MSFLHHSYPLGHLTALHSHPQAQYCYLLIQAKKHKVDAQSLLRQ